jgi:hypothetical protein
MQPDSVVKGRNGPGKPLLKAHTEEFAIIECTIHATRSRTDE